MGDTFRCSCLPGFTGRQCGVEMNECLSSPCLNGATCHNEINGYICECKKGFAGEMKCDAKLHHFWNVFFGMFLYILHFKMKYRIGYFSFCNQVLLVEQYRIIL